jgi:16S rRNA (guanine966-N2)-methyltransferase
VRPTKDIVREAMFSALDARGVIVDATVLDLYAGSGALAIEALSRGANRAVLVERDRAALASIRANIESLGLADRTDVVAQDVVRFLAAPAPRAAPFDLVLTDPSYDTPDDAVTALLVALERPGWLTPDAVVTVERPARRPVRLPPGWSSGWERSFGDTLLSFCSR